MELNPKHIDLLKLMLSYRRLTAGNAHSLGVPIMVARIMELELMGIEFGSDLADPDTIMGMDNNVKEYWLVDPQRARELIDEYDVCQPPVSLAGDMDSRKDVPGQMDNNTADNGMLFAI